MPKVIRPGAFFIAGLLSLAAPPAAAEDGRLRGGSGYFMLGGTVLDIGGLNAALETAGRTPLPSGFMTLGGGGHAFIGRLVLGGEGHALLSRGNGEAGSRPSFRGACGFFDMGFVLHESRGIVVYPLFGVGAGAIALRTAGRASDSFDEVLAGPGPSQRLQKSGFLLNFALGAERRFPPIGGRLLVGIRLGYVLAPVRSGWELDGRELEGGPYAGWAGPYLRISIGWGGARGARGPQ